MTLQFLHPEYFWLWLSIPLLIMLFIISRRLKKRSIAKYGNSQTLQSLMPLASKYRGWAKIIVLCLALFFLVLALTRPQLGVSLKDVKVKGVEVMIALDVSNSMLATDFTPNRLERAKKAISRLVDDLKGDRIGLIVFAGDAFVQLPVTADYVSAKLFLNSINPAIVNRQGTDIEKAIHLAIRSFSLQSEKSRALIIITDGENHEGDPVKMAKEAHNQGITIYTIGMGQPQGAPIKLANGDFLRDKDGNMVVSKLDENILRQLADAGGGSYTRASQSDLGLNSLVKNIREMDKQDFASVQFNEYDELFMYPLMIALILLLLEGFIADRKNRYFSRFNPFR